MQTIKSNKFIISNMHILHRLGIQPKRRQYLQHPKCRSDLLDLFWTRTHTCPNVVFPFKWEIASRASRARWCSISRKMIKIKKSVHTYLLSRDEVWKITGMVSISVYMDLYWVNQNFVQPYRTLFGKSASYPQCENECHIKDDYSGEY